MGSVSFRVPDDLKEKMEHHDEINWSALLRHHLEDEVASLESRNVARAVATSERLCRTVDAEAVADQNTATVVREFRDTRHGPTADGTERRSDG